MKILVLVADYPNLNQGMALSYAHNRNMEYKRNGIDTEVLNFSADSDYIIDDIQVISLASYKQNNEKYDLLISHAPNIRNHYKFLKEHSDQFKHRMFFFHGHEVLKTTETYPKDYDFVKGKGLLQSLVTRSYDRFKLKVWQRYFRTHNENTHLVFVSQWMKTMFEGNIDIKDTYSDDQIHIIYNSIGSAFEKTSYDSSSPKDYDFITIRSYLDQSKYGIDIVANLAKNNPELKFLVIGKGDYFKIRNKETNIDVLNTHLSQTEIIAKLNTARVALLPTRLDAQGVMACEIASIGMPLITSDIDVCAEVFEGFNNVLLINNQDQSIHLQAYLDQFEAQLPFANNPKYHFSNTVRKEVELIQSIL